MTDEQTVDPILPNIKAKTTIAGIVLALLFPFLLVLALKPLHLSFENKMLLNPLVFWGEVLLLAGYAYLFEHRPLLLWKNREFDALFFAGSVMLLYFICYGANIIATIPRLFGIHENRDLIKRLTAVLKQHHFLLVILAITAGVTEEVIFRGYILTRLSLFFKNKYVPLVITSLLFAALHLTYKSLSELIFTFLIGMIFGFYYLKYRDIRVIIVVHFLIDLVAFVLAQYYPNK
jgi:membrane protease YdiL (CAAX protease family)